MQPQQSQNKYPLPKAEQINLPASRMESPIARRGVADTTANNNIPTSFATSGAESKSSIPRNSVLSLMGLGKRSSARNGYEDLMDYSDRFSLSTETSSRPFRSVSSTKATCGLSLTRNTSISEPIKPNDADRQTSSELTIDKLNFAGLTIFGREKEIAEIDECWKQMVVDRLVKRQLIMISGGSGTGKTRLAEVLKEKAEKIEGLFVRGKFDQNMRNLPYYGVSEAFAKIFGTIVEIRREKPQKFNQVCKEILNNVGSELQILVQAIPTLGELFNGQEDQRNSSRAIRSKKLSCYTPESKIQLQFAFLRLVRVLCRTFVPLVLVLDDLQWADASSLELLEVLMTDRENADIIVVCVYRSNEIDETNIFYQTRETLVEKSRGGDFRLTSLSIDNLDPDSTNKVIQSLIASEGEERTTALTGLCHRKTEGNPFFLLHFVAMLHQCKLLTFNFGSLAWQWDIDAIESTMSSSDNVLDLLKEKMNKLPEELVEVLKIVACLGTSFTWDILYRVWRSMFAREEKGTNAPVLQKHLENLVVGGFLIEVSSITLRYAWEHDNIQKAALNLIPKPDLPGFCRRIGKILVSELSDEEAESSLFVTVTLLNLSSDSLNESKELEKLAALNLRASQKAYESSAFESAALYAGKGITLLPVGSWSDLYDLTLQLYSIGATSAGYIGDVANVEKYCEEVISRDDVCLEDKFSVYNALVDSLSNRGLENEAMEVLFDVLEKCGCKFPRSTARIVFGLVKFIMTLKGKTMKSLDVTTMSRVENEKIIQMTRLVGKLEDCCYKIGDSRLPLTTAKRLEWTLKWGYCKFTAPGFASIGLIVTGILNDLQGGSKYGHDALKLLERIEGNEPEARTKLLVYAFNFSWVQSLRSMIQPMLDTYTVGLQTGDTESASWAIYFWVVLRFMMGTSLNKLQHDALLYSKQMKDLKRESAFHFIEFYRQAFLNLQGRDNDKKPARLRGRVINRETCASCKDDKFLRPGLVLVQGMLLTYFGKHVDCAELTLQNGPGYYSKNVPGEFTLMWEAHLKGVSCFAAARQTGKRKYAKLGRFFLKRMKDWSKQGNPNVSRYETLVEAEYLAWRGKKKSALRKFEAAIVQSARGGFQQDAALASERLGDFHLRVMKDKDEGIYRLKEACRYYRGWGAIGKCRALTRTIVANGGGVKDEVHIINSTDVPSSSLSLSHHCNPEETESFTDWESSSHIFQIKKPRHSSKALSEMDISGRAVYEV